MYSDGRGDLEKRTLPTAESGRTDPRTPVILLAISDADRPRAASRYALALARARSAELHVLRLLPPLSAPYPLAEPALDVDQARRRIERCVKACRQVRGWWETELAEPLPAGRLRIRSGEFVDEVAARASELDAQLIVLSPAMGRLGTTATALALAALRPVLVARGSEPMGVLVAATDLEDPKYRVVRQATEWGAILQAPVVAVHNVSCLSAPLGVFRDAGAKPVPELPRRVMTELPTALDMVVTTDLDPVEAILDQAIRYQSRMIVVGTRRGSERGRRARVPSEVIDRAPCSVLVTSLDPGM